MPWYFTRRATKADIIDEITREQPRQPAFEWSKADRQPVPAGYDVSRRTVHKCVRGNVLWTLEETTRYKDPIERDTAIGCYLLTTQRGEAGYKPMNESMGPSYYSCPLAYLDAAPEINREWRDKVRVYDAERQRARGIGQETKSNGGFFTHNGSETIENANGHKSVTQQPPKVNFRGQEYEVAFHWYSNGRPALLLMHGDKRELAGIATVNVPDDVLNPNEVLIKDYSENEGLLAALEKAGIVKATGKNVPTGLVTTRVCELLIAPPEVNEQSRQRRETETYVEALRAATEPSDPSQVQLCIVANGSDNDQQEKHQRLERRPSSHESSRERVSRFEQELGSASNEPGSLAEGPQNRNQPGRKPGNHEEDFAMSENEKLENDNGRKPEAKLACGSIRGSIWLNRSEQGAEHFTLSVARVYKAKDGTMKVTRSFREKDLQDLIDLAQKGQKVIQELSVKQGPAQSQEAQRVKITR